MLQDQETPLQNIAAYTNTSDCFILRDEDQSAILQSPRPVDTLNGDRQAVSEYMPLNPATQLRNWEVRREHVNIVKMIGKGAFSQVAKAMAWNINGKEGQTTVAVKMLKGT